MAISTQIVNPLICLAISEKLNKGNHALWKMQVLTVIHGVGLEGYLIGQNDGTDSHHHEQRLWWWGKGVTIPTFKAWSLTDQQVLGFLLSSMGKESLTQVRACRTSVETWTVIEGNFTSVTKARTVNVRIALATTKKGDLSIADYINKMYILGVEVATAGKLIDDDLISYILISLDFEYNSVVTKENLTLGEVYS
jgi:hypothetical protein